MHREIKYIVSEINIALTTNDSPLWFVCGQIAPATGFPALSPLDSIQSRRRALQSTVSSSPMLSSNKKVIYLISSVNVTNLPSAMTPTPSDGIPYGGAELGYTCGLWLMLHYFTGVVWCGWVVWVHDMPSTWVGPLYLSTLLSLSVLSASFLLPYFLHTSRPLLPSLNSLLSIASAAQLPVSIRSNLPYRT